MRLVKYLDENIQSFEDIWTQIEKDCKPFLKEAKKAGKFVWRGVSESKRYGGLTKLNLRKDRRPVDTSAKMHDYFDDIFNRHFGFKGRSNALFCTGSAYTAEDWGQPYMVFPIGKFKFIYSHTINDLFDWHRSANHSHIKWNKLYIDGVLDDEPLFASLYTNKNLAAGIRSNNEIMLNCKEYYLLHVGHKRDALDKIK